MVDDLTIAPFSETLVPGNIIGDPCASTEIIITSIPSFNEKYGIICATILTNATDNQMPLRLLNPSGYDVHLYSGVKVATVEEVSTETSLSKRSTSRELPPINFKFTDSDITENQKIKLSNILTKYRDIFAINDDELGRTSVVKHHIDLEDTKPMKMKPYRTSFENR